MSRGDNSGTHNLEKSLWKEAGLQPKGDWYIEAGQGMGATLGIANERDGYTISDRGTLLALGKRVNLPILVEGDKALLNIYSVMEVNPANGPRINTAGGKAFADFMVAPQTQNVIKNFGVDKFGQSLFVPVAGKKKQNSEHNLELIWQGIVKAIELVFAFDAEVWAITWLSLKILRRCDLNLAFARCSFGHRPGADKISRTRCGSCSDQHRDGASTGGGGTIRVDFLVAQRTAGIHGIDLFADGDGDRSSNNRFSHSGGLDVGELPGTRSEAGAAIARCRRVETPTVVALV